MKTILSHIRANYGLTHILHYTTTWHLIQKCFCIIDITFEYFGAKEYTLNLYLKDVWQKETFVANLLPF